MESERASEMRQISSQELKSIIYDLGEQKSVITKKEILAMGIVATQIEDLINLGLLKYSTKNAYLLARGMITEHHTRVRAAAEFPNAILCLDTALSFHNLTSQNPWQVWMAVREGESLLKEPKIAIQTIPMSERIFNQGVEIHILEGRPVKIYGVAKTIVDCFELDEYCSTEVAEQALYQGLREKKCTVAEVKKIAATRNFDAVKLSYFNPIIEEYESFGYREEIPVFEPI